MRSRRRRRTRPPASAARVAGDVADEVDVGLAGRGQLVGRDVERDDLGLLAEAAAEAEAEVERDADHERDVGLLEPLPRARDEAELVVGGQAPPAHAVEEDRDPERLGEPAQLLLAARPVEAGAGHDRRALGVGQELGGLLGASAGLPADRVGAGRHLRLGLGEDDVERVVDEGRAGRLGERGSIARRGQRRDRGRLLHRHRRLDQRRDERQVVDLLERARAPAHLRRPPAEHDERRAVLLRARDRAHPVGHPGPGGQRADARRSRVAFAQPSAAQAAEASWRVSMTSIPSALQPS